ncbi:MAG TPA: hypothetical protein DCE33_03800, partial [Rhodospirillaceae bacterium]|nr:hypothetical protein [Rhodospirillaceae bacterium]
MHRRPVCKEGIGKRAPVQAGHVSRRRPHQDAVGPGRKNVIEFDAILRNRCRLWPAAIQFHRDPQHITIDIGANCYNTCATELAGQE